MPRCIDTIAACGDVNRNVMASANPVESRRTPSSTTGPSGCPSTCCRARARTTRSGSTARRSRARRKQSRSTARSTCRASSRRRSSCRRINDVDVFANDLGLHRHRRERRAAGLQRVGRRRHRRDARRSGNVSAHRRRHRFRDARSSARGGRGRASRRSAISATAPCASARGSSTRSTIAASIGSSARSRGGWASRSSRRGRSQFTTNGDRFGWTEGIDGRWHLTLRIEAGRIARHRRRRALRRACAKSPRCIVAISGSRRTRT